MLFYEFDQQIITKCWSTEKIILRAKVSGLSQKHIRLRPVRLKILNLEKPLIYLMRQFILMGILILDRYHLVMNRSKCLLS